MNPTLDRDNAILWARELLGRDNWCILDTETTGLTNAEVCQIGILAPSGKVLLDALVQPKRLIPEEATAIHGITDRDVSEAMSPECMIEAVRLISSSRLLVIYNADYDWGVLQNVCDVCDTGRVWCSALRLVCAMKKYSTFVGEPGKYGDYKWQKLPGAREHSAIADCRAVLDLIKMMAAARLSTESEATDER